MAILKKMELFDHVNYSCNPMVEVDGAYHRIESTWIRRVNEFNVRPDIDITKVKYTIDILMNCYSKKPEKGHLQLAQRNWHNVPLDDVVACSGDNIIAKCYAWIATQDHWKDNGSSDE